MTRFRARPFVNRSTRPREKGDDGNSVRSLSHPARQAVRWGQWRSAARPGEEAHEIGPAKGTACRYFLLAIVPWGGLHGIAGVGGGAQEQGGVLLNVTVYSSLHTLIPYFNIFTHACTSVEGTAISYPSPPTPLPLPALNACHEPQ